MELWFSEHTRLLALVMLGGVLWSLESVTPLYHYHTRRYRHVLPNPALTFFLILITSRCLSPQLLSRGRTGDDAPIRIRLLPPPGHRGNVCVCLYISPQNQRPVELSTARHKVTEV